MEISEIYDDRLGEKTIKLKFKENDYIDGFALEAIVDYFNKKHGINYPNKIGGIDYDERYKCDICNCQIYAGEKYFVRDSAIGEYEMNDECNPVETKHNAKTDNLICMKCNNKRKDISDEFEIVKDYTRDQ